MGNSVVGLCSSSIIANCYGRFGCMHHLPVSDGGKREESCDSHVRVRRANMEGAPFCSRGLGALPVPVPYWRFPFHPPSSPPFF